MAVDFRLPDVGEGMAEAEVVRWLVQVGDRVELDQPVVEMQTDKAVVELPAPAAGRVTEIRWREGDAVPVGEVLLVIVDESEAVLYKSHLSAYPVRIVTLEVALFSP